MRRDHQDRVHPLDRDDAQDAGQRARRAIADRLVEFLHYCLHIRVLQREQAHRHAGDPVDVEHVDGLHEMPQFALGAGEHQEVPQVVGAHRRRVLHERLDDPHHFAHADVAQRNDLDRETGRQRPLRVAELRRHVAAHRRGAGNDLVDAAVLHHRRAVHPQQRLERCGQRLARNAGRRADGHLSADCRIDHVAFVQDIAKNVADHLAQVGGLEVQHDAATLLLDRRPWRQPAARLLTFHQYAGPLEHAGLVFRSRQARRLRALRRVGECG